MPKYNTVVQLTGEDGNAMMIIGRVRQALKREGVSNDKIQEFTDQAMSGDYDNVLNTAMEWVDVR